MTSVKCDLVTGSPGWDSGPYLPHPQREVTKICFIMEATLKFGLIFLTDMQDWKNFFVCLFDQPNCLFFLSRKTQMEFQYIYVVIIFRQQEIHFPYVMWITLKDIGKTEIHLGNKDPWRSENFQLQCLGTVLFSKFISRHYIVTWYFSNISFLLSSLFLFSFYIRWRLLRLTLYLWTNQKRKMEFFYNNPGFLELILSPQNFNGKKKKTEQTHISHFH